MITPFFSRLHTGKCGGVGGRGLAVMLTLLAPLPLLKTLLALLLPLM